MNKDKRTSLYDRHIALGAKMASFAGFQMPIQYSGINQEHNTVRKTAGIFDVSHMGEFKLSGPGAFAYLQKMTINDISMIEPGQAQYSAMCYPDGGIVDDLLVYRFTDHYMLVVNAANIDKDFNWLQENMIDDCELKNISDEFDLIALQGPKSKRILYDALGLKVDNLQFYHLLESKFENQNIIVARTGYTGELGFELYGSKKIIPLIWDKIMDSGKSYGLEPVGLAARDTLRMEMKYCLYGNDIDQSTNPFEAGLGWITKLDKVDFIGKNALIQNKANIKRRLVCLEMIDRAIPRPGYRVKIDNQDIGYVTSGTQSPSLEKGIGLAYVDKPHTKSETEVIVEVRGKSKQAIIVKPPFYKNGTVLI